MVLYEGEISSCERLFFYKILVVRQGKKDRRWKWVQSLEHTGINESGQGAGIRKKGPRIPALSSLCRFKGKKSNIREVKGQSETKYERKNSNFS